METKEERQDPLVYRPLELPAAIRIVVLERGSGDDPIECRLLYTTLGEHSYEALSYEWGPPSNNDPTITLDKRSVPVRENLRAALMQIRRKEEDLYLWIDALSINQDNIAERNHQVRIMGHIYKGAERVIVWLGPANDDSDSAMELFADPPTLDQNIANVTTPQFKAILALCQRSYWCRVWILQEIYLSRSYIIHCGSRSISDENLDHSLGVIAAHESYPHCKSISKSAANELVKTKHRVPPTSVTLYRWQLCILMGSDSTEPRDLVYAMLGISHDCRNGEILPEYEKPLLDVYLETVAFCKEHRGTYSTQESFLMYARRFAQRIGLAIDEDMLHHITAFNGSVVTRLTRNWLR